MILIKRYVNIIFFVKIQPRLGITKWKPHPNEGPYRPFYVTRGKYGYDCSAVIDAFDDVELDEEMKKTQSKLCIYTFCCCFICALMGLSRVVSARKHKEGGNDVEARNKLLEAKVQIQHSFVGGVILWATTYGILIVAVLPFIWIPYLIITLA